MSFYIYQKNIISTNYYLMVMCLRVSALLNSASCMLQLEVEFSVEFELGPQPTRMSAVIDHIFLCLFTYGNFWREIQPQLWLQNSATVDLHVSCSLELKLNRQTLPLTEANKQHSKSLLHHSIIIVFIKHDINWHTPIAVTLRCVNVFKNILCFNF